MADRTYEGYSFTCKQCGKIHYMDKTKNPPYDGIMLPCIKGYHGLKPYNKSDFEEFTGSYWAVFSTRVTPMNL